MILQSSQEFQKARDNVLRFHDVTCFSPLQHQNHLNHRHQPKTGLVARMMPYGWLLDLLYFVPSKQHTTMVDVHMNIIPAYERRFRIVQVIVQMILNGWSKLLLAGCCWLLLFTHYFLWKIVIFTCSAHVRAVASSQSSPLRNTFFSSLNLFEHRSRHLRQGGVVGTGHVWSC